MSSLTSETCTSCLLSARSHGVFWVRGAFGLAITGLSVAGCFADTITMLGHFSRVGVAAFVRRLGLPGGFSIFTSVLGHVIWRCVSVVRGRCARIRGSWFGAIPYVLTLLHPSVHASRMLSPGALEGTKSGKDCSSSSAVEEASVPRREMSVEGCVAKLPNWQSLFGDGSSRSSGTSRVGGATTKEGEEEGGGYWPSGSGFGVEE